jgi:anaerobic selenocysteine-containing dehydrogenase/Fe-S-cluster-containing dehydrogenase component
MSDKKQQEYWSSLEKPEDRGEFLAPPLKQEVSKLQRRDFLKLMGAGLAVATVGCTRKPVEKIIPYVNKPEEITPGVANYYATTCDGCAASCGVVAKTREGRPIKLEGNALHPMSQGALCARGQASIYNLYDPSRLQHPVAGKRGVVNQVEWAQLDQEIRGQLEALTGQGKKVAVLTGSNNSPSQTQLVADFLKPYPNSLNVAYESIVPEEVNVAQELSYGSDLTPHYRFDQAKLIVSFGADFLGTWLSPVEFSKDFSKGRRVDDGQMSRFITFESGISVTGSNADQYVPIKPGDELLIALAIANEIIVVGRNSRYVHDNNVTAVLSKYHVDRVSALTGVTTKTLRQAAKELWQNRGHGLVVGGGVKAKNAVALQVVTNLLNSALDNDGVTVDWSVRPSHQVKSSFVDLKNLIHEMKLGQVGVLVIHRGNPVFNLPESLGFKEAIKRVPVVVYQGDRMDETAAYANYVAADSHYLESWGDANPQKDVYSLCQPTIAPLFDTRSFGDSLVAWSSVSASFHDYVQTYWKRHLSRDVFKSFWQNALQEGVVVRGNGAALKRERLASSRSFHSKALSVVPERISSTEEFALKLYPSVALFDGRTANNPWLQELPDPISKVTWDNYLSLAPKLAQRMALKQGDIVKVQGKGVVAKLPVHIQPKMHDKAVMIAVGYGRTQAGHVGDGVGVDVYDLQQVGTFGVEWSGIPVALTKTGQNMTLAISQGHQTAVGRDIIRETTYQKFKQDHHAGNHGHHADLTMWSGYQYKGHKWGMAIDMTSCVGCNACMVACQSENNVPTVGKEQVILGRDMHWIRIDRYYKGGADNPEMAYQPMTCQQCDNAPCETVCPVLATMHDDEGLNQMIYNRCVGTRYCANNCPYKVRRFNYFEYTQDIASPLELLLNPDISVREKGVMEKCTFCVQRIRVAKDQAKDDGRTLGSDEVKTACQQTCPSDAIVFGDMNDKKSQVAQQLSNPRGYHVLEETNVKPNINYLVKVRNT